jgi:hypothetical protein
MKIAVDFDGTIVENEYPKIGKEKLFAFETLGALQKERHQLILWTVRQGKELEEAVRFCRKKGIEFYAINKTDPEEDIDYDSCSRKINVDCFIDDRNAGGFPGWSAIWEWFHPETGSVGHKELKKLTRKKGSFLKRLFSTSAPKSEEL